MLKFVGKTTYWYMIDAEGTCTCICAAYLHSCQPSQNIQDAPGTSPHVLVVSRITWFSSNVPESSLVAYIIMRMWHKHNLSVLSNFSPYSRHGSIRSLKSVCGQPNMGMAQKFCVHSFYFLLCPGFSLALVWMWQQGVTILINRLDIGLLWHVEALVLEHSHLPFCMLLAAYKPARVYMYFQDFTGKQTSRGGKYKSKGGNPILHTRTNFQGGSTPWSLWNKCCKQCWNNSVQM